MFGQITRLDYFSREQVIITAQMIFGTTVIDYDWPTSALTRTVTAASVPAGLAIYYGDEVRVHTGTLVHIGFVVCLPHQT